MIFVRLKAGLGNQMFQYALGRAVSLRNKVELGLELSSFKSQSPLDTPRSFALEPFRTKASVFNRLEDKSRLHQRLWRKLQSRFRPEQTFVFNPTVLRARDGAVLEGYWQSERYFAEISSVIREDFQLRNEYSKNGKTLRNDIIAAAARGEIPISIHVRRGDYVTNPLTNAYHGVCGSGYYRAAWREMLQKVSAANGGTVPHYFVFSDDMAWSRENIKPAGAITYVEHDGIVDYERMTLMSCCHHHIISNSTFAWWGAWLNPRLNKVVIAPKRWIAKAGVRTDDIVPAQWTRIGEDELN